MPLSLPATFGREWECEPVFCCGGAEKRGRVYPAEIRPSSSSSHRRHAKGHETGEAGRGELPLARRGKFSRFKSEQRHQRAWLAANKLLDRLVTVFLRKSGE